MKNNYKWPRILVALAALLLAGAIFLPIWQIQLSAPQYPEGLVLKIFANGLAGNVDVINGLNHYIGMQTLHSEDFIEFTLLPFLIGGLVLFGLIAAYISKKGVYYIYIAVFLLFAIISMVDFYRWEYNYGHSLDPNAAIQVPGMSYQPPLIGYKQLLNFGAYSIPDVGGWLFIVAGVLLVAAYIIILQPKWLRRNKSKVSITVLMLCLLQSCASGPQPINYGSDACDFCKMRIVDKKFAAEWVTEKGKVYRFDDLHCLASFRKNEGSSGNAYVNAFAGSQELNKAVDLFYIKSDALKTPMNGKVAAFTNEAAANEFATNNGGRRLSWQQIEKEMIR